MKIKTKIEYIWLDGINQNKPKSKQIVDLDSTITIPNPKIYQNGHLMAIQHNKSLA